MLEMSDFSKTKWKTYKTLLCWNNSGCSFKCAGVSDGGRVVSSMMFGCVIIELPSLYITQCVPLAGAALLINMSSRSQELALDMALSWVLSSAAAKTEVLQ